MPIHHWVRAAALILISASLLGCATSKEHLLPQEGPTMLSIYENHLTRVHQTGEPDQAHYQADSQAWVQRERAELVGYTRQVDNEISQLFPTLPNPILVMYVFPHLAGSEQLPVPGYATSFSMYSRTHYALPGEFNQESGGVHVDSAPTVQHVRID